MPRQSHAATAARIGAAICEALHAEGAHVVVHYRSSTDRAQALVDRLNVDYYGTPTPLNQLANLSVPDASMIVAQPYDPSTIAAIEPLGGSGMSLARRIPLSTMPSRPDSDV